MMIQEMKKLFLDSRRRGLSGAQKKCSPCTLDIYQRNLGNFQAFLVEGLEGGGILQYPDLKRVHLIQFLDWLDRQEAAKVWSKSTCLQMLRTLRTFFRWVDRDEDCQEAGLKGLQKYLPVIEKCPRRDDVPAIGDLSEFMGSFRTSNRWQYRDYVASSLMACCGIRIGEVCNLRIDHVNLAELLMIVDGKTGARPVAMTKEMAKLLKGWLKLRATCRTAEDSPFVFVSKYKGQMNGNGFGQRFRKHTKAHGLPRITAHTFRHMMATNYLRKGGDMEKLRMMTGHTSYKQLQEYVHLAKIGGKSMQEELEKVSLLKDV